VAAAGRHRLPGSGDALTGNHRHGAASCAEHRGLCPYRYSSSRNQALEAAGIKSHSRPRTDHARTSPSISPIGQGNQPLITIRGIGLNDFDTKQCRPENGVYIDDVYINAPSAQSFALFDLQGIQILKGPQGTLYGRKHQRRRAWCSHPFRPTDEYSSDMHVEYGSFNTLANWSAASVAPLAPGPYGPDLTRRQPLRWATL